MSTSALLASFQLVSTSKGNPDSTGRKEAPTRKAAQAVQFKLYTSGEMMSGEVTGGARVILRFEGLAVLAGAILAYSKFGNGWQIFAIYFLVPDISFLGYLAGPMVGAVTYNLAHSYIGAVACLTAGYFLSIPLLLIIGLIWSAHIGFDRMLGYGLKYQAGFGFTHLGRLGRHA